MQTWTRATVATICGGIDRRCTHEIAVGDPMLVITIPGLTRRHHRCEYCAGSPVPPDLPPVVARAAQFKGMLAPLRQALPFDREPGCDDQ